MIDVLIGAVVEVVNHRKRKKYNLLSDEINESIRRQSFGTLDKRSSMLVLTNVHLLIYDIANKERKLVSAIPIHTIKSCKRDFWNRIVLQTHIDELVIAVEEASKWQKMLNPTPRRRRKMKNDYKKYSNL